MRFFITSIGLLIALMFALAGIYNSEHKDSEIKRLEDEKVYENYANSNPFTIDSELGRMFPTLEDSRKLSQATDRQDCDAPELPYESMGDSGYKSKEGM